MSARTVAAPCRNADRCRAVHSHISHTGATVHDQDQGHSPNQNRLRRRCLHRLSHRHDPAQADDQQIAFCPVRPPPSAHHSRALATAYQTGCRSNVLTSATGLTAHNGADGTTPIASLPRGSVQSGFNEVAIRALGIPGVARPHRSLQIPSTRPSITVVISV